MVRGEDDGASVSNGVIWSYGRSLPTLYLQRVGVAARSVRSTVTGSGGQERTRRLRIAQGPSREHPLEVHGHESSLGRDGRALVVEG